ncbi:MAG: hypothetical protein HY854_05530 [Burkholderiales bacterium]|nr:hypothetical protein [Burkholderiales bacterium]
MKVPALRIEINDELVAIAGAPGLSLLSGQVGYGASNKPIDASSAMFLVMGLDVHGSQPRQLTWANGVQLKLGDRVTFELVEVTEPSPPSKVLATPSSAELEQEAMKSEAKKRAV